MLESEFDAIWKEEIIPRWPKWKFTEKDLDDWFDAFQNCNADNLRAAIKEYRIKEGIFAPAIYKVRIYLNTLSTKFHKVQEHNRNYETERSKFHQDTLNNGSMKERILLATISPVYREIDLEAAAQVPEDAITYKPPIDPAEVRRRALERYKREDKGRDGRPGKFIELEPPKGTTTMGQAIKDILAHKAKRAIGE